MLNRSNLVQTNQENVSNYSQGSYNVKEEENRFISRSKQELNSKNLDEEDEIEEERQQDESHLDESDEDEQPRNSKFKGFFNKFKKPKPVKIEEEQNIQPPLNPNPRPIKIQEYHFQTKIRNTGFWGKVKLRKGSWLVIIGLILMAIGLTVISVFWRWWYGPTVNIPCRTVGITLLILGFFAFVFGLLSNFMMIKDPLSKHFFGSPPRFSTWILLASIFGLTIASDLMTIYYTYWHNRYVNNPMIAVSIILFFFSPIAFVFSVMHNFKQMNLMRIKHDPEFAKKHADKLMEAFEKNQQNEKLNETIDEDIQNEGNFKVYNETTISKKDFRKKNLRLQPRTMLQVNNTNLD